MPIRKSLLVLGVAALFAVIGTVILWEPRERPRPAAWPKQPPPVPGKHGPRQTLPDKGRPPEATVPQMPARLDPGVAALVNGEPISSTEVDAAIDRKTYGLMMDEARKARLDRLVAIAAVRQHLAAKGVKVSDDEVQKEVEELRRNPPAADCSCCRHGSLEEFLVANMMTLKDLRDSIRNRIGLVQHAKALWAAEFPDEKMRGVLLKLDRSRIERNYVKMSHIFFNTAQQPDFPTAPDKVRETVKAKAGVVWKRLEKGEDFAKLARECSEDAFSRGKGGELGCVVRGIFGRNVESALDGLQPGECCAPVESPRGFHILRRDEMRDADVLEALQTEYVDKKIEQISSAAQSGAKVLRADGRADKK